MAELISADNNLLTVNNKALTIAGQSAREDEVLVNMPLDGNFINYSTWPCNVVVQGNPKFCDRDEYRQCAYFDGSSCVTIVPRENSLSSANDFTIALWINPVAIAQGRTWISTKAPNRYRGFFSQFTTYDAGCTIALGGSEKQAGTFARFPANSWTYYTLVRSKQTIYQFLNGNKISEYDAGYTSVTYDSNFNIKIGASTVQNGTGPLNSNGYFKGYISNVIYVNKALWTDNFTPPELIYTPYRAPNLCDNISLSTTTLSIDGEIESTAVITATLLPTGAESEVQWSTSNGLIASVENGTITAYNNGEVDITATCGNKSAACHVIITNIAHETLYHLGEYYFNGSTRLDSGIKLFDTAKTFTIACTFAPTYGSSNGRLFYCGGEATGASLYQGTEVLYSCGLYWSTSNLCKYIATYTDGVLTDMAIRTGKMIRHITIPDTVVYTASTNNLIIGTSSNSRNYYTGTIYHLNVFDFAMTADQMDAFLNDASYDFITEQYVGQESVVES